MTDAKLRAKIRALMATGASPSESPSIERRGAEEAESGARFAVLNPSPQEPCAICGEPRTQVSLFYMAGLVVRVHAACEALLQQERTSSHP